MFDIIHGSFIWNADKEQINIERHGISFKEASQVFLDPRHLIEEDMGHSATEDRYFCMGKVNGVVLAVRFTYRDGLIRIIGAGYWRKWRKYYEEKTRP